MRKTFWKVGLSAAAVVLLSSSAAYAQRATANSRNVTVASRARLTLSTATLIASRAVRTRTRR